MYRRVFAKNQNAAAFGELLADGDLVGREGMRLAIIFAAACGQVVVIGAAASGVLDFKYCGVAVGKRKAL